MGQFIPFTPALEYAQAPREHLGSPGKPELRMAGGVTSVLPKVSSERSISDKQWQGAIAEASSRNRRGNYSLAKFDLRMASNGSSRLST